MMGAFSTIGESMGVHGGDTDIPYVHDGIYKHHGVFGHLIYLKTKPDASGMARLSTSN